MYLRAFVGGDVSFSKYEDLEAAFANQEIHPGDLKNAVEMYINRLLDPIRKEFEANSKLKSLVSKAYPPQKQSIYLFLYLTMESFIYCC